MSFDKIFATVEQLPFAKAVAESTWMFPTIEVVHVCAIVLVVGAIAMLDLRLLGLARRDQGVVALGRDTLVLVWLCFAIALITGVLMFASAAVRYAGLLPFQAKMALLVLAGLNMGWFHATVWLHVDSWDQQLRPPLAARLAGGLSLALWTGIVIAGRWIGFL
jgi:hypothetical protein